MEGGFKLGLLGCEMGRKGLEGIGEGAEKSGVRGERNDELMGGRAREECRDTLE